MLDQADEKSNASRRRRGICVAFDDSLTGQRHVGRVKSLGSLLRQFIRIAGQIDSVRDTRGVGAVSNFRAKVALSCCGIYCPSSVPTTYGLGGLLLA